MLALQAHARSQSAIETPVTAETLDANVKGPHGPTEREIGKRAISRLAEEVEAGEETVDHLLGMVREALARHNEAAYDTRHVKLAAWVAKLWKLRVGEAPIRRYQCPTIGKTCRILSKSEPLRRPNRREMELLWPVAEAGASLARKPSTTQTPPNSKFHQISSVGIEGQSG